MPTPSEVIVAESSQLATKLGVESLVILVAANNNVGNHSSHQK
jgi:hypothetical protein